MTTPLQQAAQDLIEQWDNPGFVLEDEVAELRKALDAELALAVKPVAKPYTFLWEADGTLECMKGHVSISSNTGPAHGWKVTPLYLHPPQQAKQVPMTDDQIIATFCTTPDFRQYVSAFKAGVKLAEKYHGIGGQP